MVALALACVGAIAACRSSKTPEQVADSKPSDPPPKIAEPPRADEPSSGRLVAFKDDEDLAQFRERWHERDLARQKQLQQRVYPMSGPISDAGPPPAASAASPSPVTATPPAAAPAPKAAAESRAAAKPAPDASGAQNKGTESITNNQHAQVDEGDIVKLHGDHLVVLRRGRLFTISLEGGRIRQSKMHDAFGPDIDPRGTWYDEMVVEGDHVVVVGFSYARGGTEVGLFKIDNGGDLTYRATYHLRSNDYYSARNYASRIVDGQLVFYSPGYVYAGKNDIKDTLPAVRRWKKDAKPTDFVRTLAANRLYHVEGSLPESTHAAIHTVTTCDLRKPELPCDSVGIMGPQGRVFYVSPSAVYVWMQDYAYGQKSLVGDDEIPHGMLAKLPIRRDAGKKAAPTAVRVAGMPTDQFSFEEDEGGYLDVLVRAQSNGDFMFASEATSGDAALLRVPQTLFSDRVPIVSNTRYRQVPRPDGYSVQNRFVGPWLLYGAGNGYVTSQKGRSQLYAVKYASPKEEPKTVLLEQGVDRIEPMGGDAVVVGSRQTDLVFSSIALGDDARAASHFVRKNASQGELRSHGFFYKPAKDSKDGRTGIIGLPIRSEGHHGARYLIEGSASVLFLSNKKLDLSELGSLAAGPLKTNHDGCRASCVDWYGNARPIFAKNRVFALMGYELVEGWVDDKRIGEKARISFAPVGGAAARDEDF